MLALSALAAKHGSGDAGRSGKGEKGGGKGSSLLAASGKGARKKERERGARSGVCGARAAREGRVA